MLEEAVLPFRWGVKRRSCQIHERFWGTVSKTIRWWVSWPNSSTVTRFASKCEYKNLPMTWWISWGNLENLSLCIYVFIDLFIGILIFCGTFSFPSFTSVPRQALLMTLTFHIRKRWCLGSADPIRGAGGVWRIVSEMINASIQTGLLSSDLHLHSLWLRRECREALVNLIKFQQYQWDRATSLLLMSLNSLITNWPIRVSTMLAKHPKYSTKAISF